MDANEKLDNLERLTAEADMLSDIMHDTLAANQEKIGITKIATSQGNFFRFPLIAPGACRLLTKIIGVLNKFVENDIIK